MRPSSIALCKATQYSECSGQEPTGPVLLTSYPKLSENELNREGHEGIWGSPQKNGLNCSMQGNPDSQIREIFTIGIRVPRIQNCLGFLYMGPFKPFEIGIICHCQKDSCKTGLLGQGYRHKKCRNMISDNHRTCTVLQVFYTLTFP